MEDAEVAVTNAFWTGQFHVFFRCLHRSIADDPIYKNKTLNYHLLHQKIPYSTLLKREWLFMGYRSTTSLGTFEVLRSWRLRKNGKDGRQLPLYEEAGCGLISGAFTMFAVRPMSTVAYTRLENFTCRNFCTAFYRICSNEGYRSLYGPVRGVSMAAEVAAYTGMLASYHPTLEYLVHDKGVTKWKANAAASMVSAFFVAACTHPFQYLKPIKPHQSIRQLLTPYSGYNFYTDFFKRFRHAAAFCLVQYAIFEEISKPRYDYLRSHPIFHN